MSMKSFLVFTLGLGFSIFASAQTKPTFPGYASCPVTNGVINATCISDVNYTYNQALLAYNKSIGLVTDTYSGTSAPTAPTYSCVKNTDGSYDNACENAYATQVKTYNTNLSAYNALQAQAAETAQLQAAAQQTRVSSAASTTSSSTAAALSSSIEQNKSGAKIYTLVSVVTAGMAAMEVAKQNYGLAAMYAGMSILAMTQVKSHNKSADSACTSLTQISTTSSSCSSASDSYVSTTPAGEITKIADQIDTTTGTCKTSAPASCTTIVTKANEQGVDVKSLVGAANQFAGANSPIKFNADGTITTKDGKTYKPSDFASEEAMAAAGFSAADIQAASSQMNGPNGVLAKAGLDVKGDLKDLAKTDFGSFASIGSGSGSSSSSDGGSTSAKSALGSKDASGRKPSSSNQGLIRTFNGDSIGIANDDIFKMMNKRYKLKTAQDSFIAP